MSSVTVGPQTVRKHCSSCKAGGFKNHLPNKSVRCGPKGRFLWGKMGYSGTGGGNRRPVQLSASKRVNLNWGLGEDP